MSKKKSKTKYKIILYVVLIVILTSGYFLFANKKSPLKSTISLGATKSVIYPKQYSDDYITENAKVSDSKFKSLTFLNNSGMLANVISLIPKTQYNLQTEERESGTWLWTPVLYLTPTYRDEVISEAKKNGIKNIYLSIDSYLDIFVMSDGPEKEKIKKEFDDKFSGFVKVAHANGITVDAEGGWRNWAEVGHQYKAVAVLDYAIEYNKTHTEKLRGFQYDVEPYLLSEYKLDKEAVLGNYINLINQSVAKLNESDLELSVVIPEFYDGAYGETPKFSFRGKDDFAIEHLLRVLDQRKGSKIIIMSYRNFSQGDDGSIQISKNEIDLADKFQTKIIVAQEIGEAIPAYITFHNTTRNYFDKQTALILNAFKDDKSFNGFATHYINAFAELK